MRVALLAPANSIHTVRWVNGLVARGLEVHLISAHHAEAGAIDPSVRVHQLNLSAPAAYLLSSGQVAACLKQIGADLLNAHYASGYGLLARMTRFRPMLLSVWGSDVYEFPRTSPLHRWLIRGNLRSATAIASTSECMARKVTELFSHPHLFVTPFGVDESIFVPGRDAPQKGQIVIGTVKTLARKYGVDVLIDAFALVVRQMGQATRLRLEITGSGPEEHNLKRQVERLGLVDLVAFNASVPHESVPRMLRRLDIFVALSRDSESFGVAAVEAAACEKPIVVSNAEGFVEVIRHNETGLIVPRNDALAASGALARLLKDEELRSTLGRNARAHVLKHYTWDISLDRMIDAYSRTVSGRFHSC